MKKLHLKTTGITLVETIIYVALLSFLMSGFFYYAYGAHISNLKLLNEIQDAENQ